MCCTASIFIQTEDGLSEIDCHSFPLAESYDDVIAALSALYGEEHDYRTVVIDSADWLERLIWDEVCDQYGVKSIEKADGGYAKGYTHALTQWREVLTGLDALRVERDMAVIIIAHAKIEKFEDPETAANRRHWANADALSADAAASAEVRRILRNRARYEVANNSYARGIVTTLANDTVGTGPRLQMLTGDDGINRRMEREFDLWAQEVSLPEKLRTMRMARAQDGEAFGVLVTNGAMDHPVKLDIRLIEADQVTSPLTLRSDNREVDGIRLDSRGNPVAYRVLKNHPGGSEWAPADRFATIPASSMIHIFRQERPGQHRGVPEITPALPLFAQLRRFTLAVLGAAEAAADFAGILYTDAPPSGEADAVEPMDLIELERNMLLTMPGGWKMSQLQPSQPATTYAEFKKEILNEIARCLNMPFNVAAGNSFGYNYASGCLDHQTHFHFRMSLWNHGVRRSQMVAHVPWEHWRGLPGDVVRISLLLRPTLSAGCRCPSRRNGRSSPQGQSPPPPPGLSRP